MLISALIIIKMKGYGFAWQVLCLITFMSQTFVMYFAGEARPYMALSGFSLASLIYFAATGPQRQISILRYSSWLFICLLVLFHPFGIIYIAMMWLWSTLAYGETFPKQRWTRLWFSASGTSRLLFAIGIAATCHGPIWLLGGAGQKLDPFAFSAREALTVQVLVAHLGHLAVPHYSWRLLLILALAALLFTLTRNGASILKSQMVAPSTLILFSFLVTGLIIAISYFNGYWILSRQWIASMALVTFGSIWLLAAASKAIDSKSKFLSIALWAVFASFVVPMAWLRGNEQVERLRTYRDVAETERVFWTERRTLTPDRIWLTYGVTGTANANGVLGSEVWPVVACLYGSNCPGDGIESP
jgi:hypothetical protein